MRRDVPMEAAHDELSEEGGARVGPASRPRWWPSARGMIAGRPAGFTGAAQPGSVCAQPWHCQGRLPWQPGLSSVGCKISHALRTDPPLRPGFLPPTETPYIEVHSQPDHQRPGRSVKSRWGNTGLHSISQCLTFLWGCSGCCTSQASVDAAMRRARLHLSARRQGTDLAGLEVYEPERQPADVQAAQQSAQWTLRCAAAAAPPRRGAPGARAARPARRPGPPGPPPAGCRCPGWSAPRAAP